MVSSPFVPPPIDVEKIIIIVNNPKKKEKKNQKKESEKKESHNNKNKKNLNGKKQHRSNHRFPQGELGKRTIPSLSSYLIAKESVTQ